MPLKITDLHMKNLPRKMREQLKQQKAMLRRTFMAKRHDVSRLIFSLPPKLVSVNAGLSVGWDAKNHAPTVYKTPARREWDRKTIGALKRQATGRCVRGEYTLLILIPGSLALDLDNGVKAMSDALERAHIIENDTLMRGLVVLHYGGTEVVVSVAKDDADARQGDFVRIVYTLLGHRYVDQENTVDEPAATNLAVGNGCPTPAGEALKADGQDV